MQKPMLMNVIGWRTPALLATCSLLLQGCATPPSTAPSTPTNIAAPLSVECKPNPLGQRYLFVRGTMNSWNARDEQRLLYACNQFTGVLPIKGEHQFKLGDDDWSADADFGLPQNAKQAVALTQPQRWALTPKGGHLSASFDGLYRFTLTMNTSAQPTLAIEPCINPTPPLGNTILFLRGTMNNWAALDEYAFQYSCDAYYLNVQLGSTQEFKISDASWANATTFGVAAGQQAPLKPQTATALNAGNSAIGAHNTVFKFDGEHTVRLAFVNGKPELSIGPKTFADPQQKAVTNAVALTTYFDSRNTTNKRPYGAIKSGTPVQFALAAAPGVQSATLVVEQRTLEGNQEKLEYKPVKRIAMSRSASQDSKRSEQFSASHTFESHGIYGYYFELIIDGQPYVYQNNTDSIFWTREKGSGGVGAIDYVPSNPQRIRRFRQTVYKPDFVVPAWARDAVYYYIFPDRFRNGNLANDPKPGVTRYHEHTVEMHPKWIDKPWRPGTGDGSDAHYNNDFFGGDLQGIIDKLDYIRDLGANVIYMTPVFRAASNHKYDTADYRNIDPHFGTNEDFTRLTVEAAKRGIKVIPDTSLNHTGSDSIYFDRFNNFARNGQSAGAFAGAKIQPQSTYADWYTFDAKQSDPNKQFTGWVGVTDLPELNKNSPGLRQFFFGKPDSVMQLWLDRGAAGWRMDVAPWVPDDFWAQWRTAIKQHRPDALTIAETWFDSSKFFLGDSFDSTMNYIFRNAVLEYANGGDARKLYQNMELMREYYPPQSFYALMNLLSSHDQARGLHVLGWHDDKTAASEVADAKQKMRLAVLFQMVFPGAPAIYYGDEVGLGGGDDPYNRAPYPWADQGGKPDDAMLQDFKRMIAMRHQHAVLRHGSLQAPTYIDANVIVLAREHAGKTAMTALNNAAQAKSIQIALPAQLANATFKDALSGQAIKAQGTTLSVSVPAHFGLVLINQ